MASAPTQASIEAEIATLRAAKLELLKAPLKGTVGDDSYDNTGRLELLNGELAKLEDELRRALQGPKTCVRGRRQV